MKATGLERIRATEQHDGQVLKISLDHPKGNIVDLQMMEDLSRVLDAYAGKPDLKLIRIGAEGKHFSFGASVEEHRKAMAATMIANFHKLIRQIAAYPVPVLCEVQGLCLGGAFELVLASHIVIASADAKFGQPEIALSVFPPPASILLPLKVGQSKAADLLVTGRNMDTEEAYNAGLITSISAEVSALDEVAEYWIKKNILPKSAVAIRYALKAQNLMLIDMLDRYLPQLERLYVQELMETADANEGIESFLEKRKPVWQNN